MNERMSKLLANPVTIPTAVGLVAFGVGVSAGYILGKKRGGRITVYPRVPENLDEALASLKEPRRPKPVIVDESYLAGRDGQDLGPTVTVEDDLTEAFLEPVPQPETEPELVEDNVFANNGDDWDLQAELAKRAANPGEPYVVHRDEFFEPDDEHEGYLQHQLTYYNGDKVLADEDQKPVYDQRIVGDCLDRFGQGSGDPNVVYVRSELHKAEYEIMLDVGHFAVEVQGLDDDDREFKHTQPTRRNLRD